MKTEPDKKNKIPYSITITTQFELYFTKKEEDDGVEILEIAYQRLKIRNLNFDS